MGIDGLMPTLLVYGIHPKLPSPDFASTTMPRHKRFLAQKLARDEYAMVFDEKRFQAVQRAKSPSVKTDFTWRDSVVVFRQASRRWEEPLRFVTELDHGFQICDTQGDLKLFSKPCVRLYAHGLEFDRYSNSSGVPGPLSTLQLEYDVAPDRVRKNQDVSLLDTSRPQSRPDLAPVQFSEPVHLSLAQPQLLLLQSKFRLPRLLLRHFCFPKIKEQLRSLK